MGFTVLLVMAAGCDTLTTVCTLEIRPAVSVLVVDAATNSLVDAETVTATARDGEYVDSMSVPVSFTTNPIELAGERPGSYDVTVQASGYEDWRQEGVGVGMTSDGCHVETAELEARLSR